MKCKICDSESSYIFSGRILKKYDVCYYRCINCDFIQTDEPYWLEESYASAISDLDLGPVNRAVTGARIVESIILTGFDPNASFIDWGGGYGIFTRLMRDSGYDFWWKDLYCENLFAKKFCAEDSIKYQLMTSFEVFEHLVNPIKEIKSMRQFTSNILFTTLIPQFDMRAIEDCWYFTPEHGQHIAIYSVKSLKYIAEMFDLHLSTDGQSLHLLSKKQFPQRLFRAIARDRRAAQLIRRIGRRRLRRSSLLMDDFRSVTGWSV
jgi:hypothetical protein